MQRYLKYSLVAMENQNFPSKIVVLDDPEKTHLINLYINWDYLVDFVLLQLMQLIILENKNVFFCVALQ